MKRILLLLVALISINAIQAQDKKDKNKKEVKKKYEEIITNDAESSEGLWYTHKLDGKHYFEFPDSNFRARNIGREPNLGIRQRPQFRWRRCKI